MEEVTEFFVESLIKAAYFTKRKCSYFSQKFVKRANRNKQITMNFIKKQIKKDKKIFLYGASTKKYDSAVL